MRLSFTTLSKHRIIPTCHWGDGNLEKKRRDTPNKDTPLPLSEAATSRQPAIMPVSSAPGKSFLAMTTATVLAEDSSKPVRLIECNWEHPSLSDVMIRYLHTT